MSQSDGFDPHDTRGPYVAAEEDAAASEVDRLRGLIRAVVHDVQPASQCSYCSAWLRGPIEAHLAGCHWPALVVEAERP